MRDKIALALLTWQPQRAQLDFFSEFQAYGYKSFAIVDSNEWQAPEQTIDCIRVDTDECKDNGFKELNPIITQRIGSPCSAWEKALFFFCTSRTDFDHVWFIEDDVFIPSHETIVAMDRAYEQDIVSADNRQNWDGELKSWDWYVSVPGDLLPLPWAKSMVCAVRLSRRVLSAVREFLAINRDFSPLTRHIIYKQYFFIEYLFHTLALHRQFDVVIAKELSTIVWRKDWAPEELQDGFLYHPVKDVGLQTELRNLMRGRPAVALADPSEPPTRVSD